MRMPRFGFVTCVQLGLVCMEAIYRIGGRLELAVTLHDHLGQRKSGRVYIDGFCTRNAIDLIKIGNVNEPTVIDAVVAKQIDWLLIIGWSQIARKPLLDAPALGTLGIHPTLLPEGRGRASIPWAILKGLKRTGVTLFKLDEGVDTGEIVAQKVLPIAPDETAYSLYKRVQLAHESLIEQAWAPLSDGAICLKPQDEGSASQWPARAPEDGRITAQMNCQDIDRLVRATAHPYPGAFFDTSSHRYRIWAGVAEYEQAHFQFLHFDGRTLEVPATDGRFIATEWAEEEKV
jgi:methionyl-tRNA formyltransferase